LLDFLIFDGISADEKRYYSPFSDLIPENAGAELGRFPRILVKGGPAINCESGDRQLICKQAPKPNQTSYYKLDSERFHFHIWNTVRLVVDFTAKKRHWGRGCIDRTTHLLGQGTLNWEYV